MKVGTEWLVDASGCASRLLSDRSVVQRICDEIIRDLDLHVIGAPAFHQFPEPGGLTVFYMLTESHLACHTYPEAAIATFNLYCCRERPDWPWAQRLGDMLEAKDVTVKTLRRGDASNTKTPALSEGSGANL